MSQDSRENFGVKTQVSIGRRGGGGGGGVDDDLKFNDASTHRVICV